VIGILGAFLKQTVQISAHQPRCSGFRCAMNRTRAWTTASLWFLVETPHRRTCSMWIRNPRRRSAERSAILFHRVSTPTERVLHRSVLRRRAARGNKPRRAKAAGISVEEEMGRRQEGWQEATGV